jgi:PAS domain S-box-containing protein
MQMKTGQNSTDRMVALKIIAIYALFSCLWVSASDIVLHEIIPDPVILNRIDIFKDILFIVLTIALLYQLIKRYSKICRQAQEARYQLEFNAAALDHYRAARLDALENLAIVAGGVPTLIAHMDLSQRYQYVNANYAAWVGRPENEIIGATVREIIGEDIYRTTVGCIEQVMNGQFAFMERKAGIQGEERIQHMSFIPRIDEKGAVTSYFALINDITDIKQAEYALHASEQKFRNLLENVRLAAVIIDQNGSISFCNDFLCEISGWQREEIINRNWFEHFVPQETRETVKSALASDVATTALSLHFEDVLLTRIGAVRQIAWNMTRLHDADGRVNGTALIGADVTEHRKTEEQLRQAQKMEAIGTLAGGVAHDFNNILTIIIGCAEMVRSCTDGNPRLVGQYIGQIIEAADRAAGLTHSLLAFSRKQDIEVMSIDLNSQVRRLEELLCRIIGEDITLTLSLCNCSLNVMADGGQLDQVIMNMISNARDAMPRGGGLKISTYLAERFLPLPDGCAEITAVPCAVLEIADTGFGMNSATLERIFDPFYTTKEVGKGTGLGLSMAYGIVKSHNGFIEVESEQAEGTIFRIFLPCIDLSPKKTKGKRLSVLPVGDETILLVEDDPALLQIIKTLLEKHGYRTLIAHNGEEALDLFRTTVEPIHLILTDVIMPGKNGIEMSQEISALHPGIPIVFMSGYAADFMDRIQNSGQVVHYISKPLKLPLLLKKIRKALASANALPLPETGHSHTQRIVDTEI